jgi:hypothetical protein
MEYTVARGVIFVALAVLTLVLAYLYQRRQRVQRLSTVWIWPAVFALLALGATIRQLPGDPALAPWLAFAFVLGIGLGAARAATLKMRAADEPGAFTVAPTPISGAIFLFVLIFNEFQHVFRHGEAVLGRISCALLILSAGSSIAVNAGRVFRYRSALARATKDPGNP